MKHIETFQKRLYQLDEDTILRMREFDSGHINNVVVGIEKECYGLMLKDDTTDVIFQIFYIISDSGLKGELLELSSNLKSRNELTFLFSRYLSQKYQHLNPYIVFNTFQHFVRTLFEKLGYYTYTDDLLTKIKGRKATIIVKTDIKGLVYVPFIKESDIAKFSENADEKVTQGKKRQSHTSNSDNFVYLLHNKQNGYHKIGRSMYPFFREKTLQAQEPDIELIKRWKAPHSREKMLQKQFTDKRLRGEWFNLNENDMSVTFFMFS